MTLRTLGSPTAGIAALVLACAACSSSSTIGNGTASVTGTIQGMTVPASDAVGLSSTVSDGGKSESAVGVIVTNIAGACSALQTHDNPANAITLTIEVTAAGTRVAPGAYSVVPSGFGASAAYAADDSNCNETASARASSGTVTLTTVTASQVTGSFSLTFDGTDMVTGTFSAPICTYSNEADAAASACKP